MKRVLLATALCAFALSGCDTLRRWMGMPSNDKPTVTIVNGLPSVDPEPLEFPRHRRNVTIVWHLDDATARFVSDGIRIDGEVVPGRPPDPRQTEVVDCRVVGNGSKFQCKNKNSRPGTYKYTIRVRLADGRVVEKDPSIVNMQ
jgi:hypothetical protein